MSDFRTNNLPTRARDTLWKLVNPWSLIILCVGVFSSYDRVLAQSAAQSNEDKKKCAIADVRKVWIAKHREIADANKLLDSLNAAAKTYKRDDFGHNDHTIEEKKQLQEEATELFARARITFDKLISKIASRTTRACEVCSLKEVYEKSVKAGLDDLTENQLRGIASEEKKVDRLDDIVRVQQTLQQRRLDLKAAEVGSERWLTLSALIKSLENDRAVGIKEIVGAPQSVDKTPFSKVLGDPKSGGFKC
jgi:hypothetical protein